MEQIKVISGILGIDYADSFCHALEIHDDDDNNTLFAKIVKESIDNESSTNLTEVARRNSLSVTH